ncbi:zinc ribbon domain-containing protein [archaeon]|nr:zinc ribbon domain-containing protein [archaeon]
MFRKKCRSCGEKVEKKFNYCPWCGGSLKVGGDRDDFGMLGRDDSRRIQEEMKLPFGMEKIMGSLVKQLEKQMGNMNFDEKDGFPKGIKIQIARKPMGQVVQKKVPKMEVVEVSEKEADRRAGLKKVEAKSRVKRLGDVIIYEIETPGLKKKEDVVITELATGLEIRAYSKDRCYVKVIPLKVEILSWRVDRERVMVELRG